MANFNNQNQKITFLENTSPIISELLEKYQLQETSDELLKKLLRGESPRGGIILDIVIEIAQGKILKKDLVFSLQKRLNIPKDKTKRLAKDVEKKLLVLIKKVPKEEIETREGSSVPSEIKSVVPPEKLSIAKKTPIVEKPLMAEKSEEPSKEQKPSEKPDVYREPIE